ncbi:hypothetical protein [Nocardia abscessus]|uniref:hypothetical protein n=1 Tax=Nocardia abscessus TaxID=120957 RepID=UPI002458F68D|nr:hypothetical protein [Nocardia abscessus]
MRTTRNTAGDSATDAPAGACPELLWVLVATPRGTASSPWHVLFFDQVGNPSG